MKLYAMLLVLWAGIIVVGVILIRRIVSNLRKIRR